MNLKAMPIWAKVLAVQVVVIAVIAVTNGMKWGTTIMAKIRLVEGEIQWWEPMKRYLTDTKYRRSDRHEVTWTPPR